MKATLFHTAHSHVQRFDRARDRVAPGVELVHRVREDWLARARNGMSEKLRAEILAEIGGTDGPRICTCTTIGAVAETAGATRVDRPMMTRAARIGGPVLFVYCFNSTLAPSLDLLRRAFGDTAPDLRMLDLGADWPLFERGDHTAFEQAIARQVTQASAGQHGGCILLAQASMSGAASLIHSPLPVLASPETALSALFTP